MTITPSPIPNSFVANSGMTVQLQAIDIGPLNMNSTNFINIDVGIDRTKIIGISWRINNDNGNQSFIGPFGLLQGWQESINASISFVDLDTLGSTIVQMSWDNIGYYGSQTQFSGTTVNRMTLMIWYLS